MTRNEYRKQWREQMKLKGICTNCGCKPVLDNYTKCCHCHNKQRECREALRQTRKLNKLCRECKNPATSTTQYCELHHQLATESQVRLHEQGYFAKRNWQQFKKVLDLYGKECICCQEGNPAFLTVDHINNNGATERKESHDLYAKYLKEKRDDLQILCMNCNFAKQRIGVCPHQL